MYEIAPELKERPIFFMKFSKEKWILESLRKGNLYMNTIGHFKKLEEETKKRGMGDKDEVALVLNQLDISLYDYETGNLFLKGFAGREEAKLDLRKIVKNMHSVCVTLIFIT